MAIDISQYLEVIAGNGDGEEVAIAIHDASLLLGTEMYKTADIDELLVIIKNGVFGRNVRDAIHETLKRLADSSGQGSLSDGVYGYPIIIPGSLGTFYICGDTPIGYVEVETEG